MSKVMMLIYIHEVQDDEIDTNFIHELHEFGKNPMIFLCMNETN